MLDFGCRSGGPTADRRMAGARVSRGRIGVSTTPERSRLMSRVRQHGTSPELTVRRALTDLGARYRVNSPSLPGRPDISNRSRKKAIFVHGCFWHGHEGCRRSRTPASNRDFWVEKIRQNRIRDAKKRESLIALGFSILEIWECELADEPRTESRLREFWSTPTTSSR